MEYIVAIPSEKNMYYVYVLINAIDDLVFYVGKGKQYRPQDHIRDAMSYNKQYHVHRKIREIYNNGGSVYYKFLFKSLSESLVLSKEIEFISMFGRKTLCNLTDGGEGSSGFKHKPEVIEKLKKMKIGKKLSPESISKRQATRKVRGIRAWNLGKKMNEEFCRKVAKGGLGKIPWNKGKVVLDEIRAKISRGLIGHKISEKSKMLFIERSKKPHSLERRKKASEIAKNRVFSKATREKLRKAGLNRHMSQENKIKLSLANKGRKFSDSHRENIRVSRRLGGADEAQSKKVICINSGQLFPSLTDAGKSVNRTAEAVADSIRRGGLCAGLSWKLA